MFDPIVQDTEHYHDNLAKYNRDFENMIKEVLEDDIFFENFVRDYMEYAWNHYSDNELKKLHQELVNGKHEESELYYKHVRDEAKSRIEG